MSLTESEEAQTNTCILVTKFHQEKFIPLERNIITSISQKCYVKFNWQTYNSHLRIYHLSPFSLSFVENFQVKPFSLLLILLFSISLRHYREKNYILVHECGKELCRKAADLKTCASEKIMFWLRLRKICWLFLIM
jgi:hypothetical protein